MVKCLFIEGCQKEVLSPNLKKDIAVLNLDKIQNFIDKKDNEIKGSLDLKTLKEKKLIGKKYLKLKILGNGEIKKGLEISAHYVSKQALNKIEKAGGKFNLLKIILYV